MYECCDSFLYSYMAHLTFSIINKTVTINMQEDIMIHDPEYRD